MNRYILILIFFACSSCNHCRFDEEPILSHSCPKAGHGECPICFDPLLNTGIVKK